MKDLLHHAKHCRELVHIGAAQQARDGDGSSRPRTQLLINVHIEVAEACGADGVHLPEAMLDAAPGLKAHAQPGRQIGLVGASVHSVVR